MAIYALADLHLSLSNPEKSMDVFGKSWDNYIPRIEENWKKTITDEDTVLVAGDISWVTYLQDAVEDFKFLNNLPGKKILCRGNHDYWWTSFSKMEKFLVDNELDNIKFSRTNVIEADGCLISGTRGWMLTGENENKAESRKIFDREVVRLNICVDELKKADPDHEKTHILMVHYPPVTNNIMNNEFSRIIESGQVDICIYGHLHGLAHRYLFESENKGGVKYLCTASDYLGFMPVKIVD